jgi:L-threonate 2-dehydrogenase
MTTTIAVIAPGMMGAAIGARLTDNGAKVITLLEGRSAETISRAEDAGMTGASLEVIAAADMILSVLPPGDALELAKKLGPVLAASGNKPHYADLNAVNPETAVEIGAVIEKTGCRYIDGGIIGGPPKEGYAGPVIYVSGPDASAARILGELGLNCKELDATIGTASALKMCYGGITKGVTAIGTTLALAASRAGIADALRQELMTSQAVLYQALQRSVPDMFGKAYRWVAEMEEISTFVGKRAEGDVHKAIAGLYDRLAKDYDNQRKEIDALAHFFRKDG